MASDVTVQSRLSCLGQKSLSSADLVQVSLHFGKIAIYELLGDYYLPCLVVTPMEKQTIGAWGRKHQQYLKEYRPVLYSKLVLNGRLHSYLVGIDDQARNRLSLLSTHLAKAEGVNEQLKERDQMAWVRAMNNIRNRAEETILNDLIYGEG